MVQGTTSDAGKSVLVTGLCRLFRRRGIAVAPFKPQNMALNSAVTVDGGEIGRSQAVQAMACGIEPHSDMNPVLLKPNSDTGAQVIVQGQVLGNREAGAYMDYKREAMPWVMESFDRLSRQYDLVVVEGAGSPAEINLRENDIANMGFALAADCPVIIVADIDRGGVFAHLVGTLDCLASAERELVRGFVINRFRGDQSLLDPGVDWLTERTGVPTLGVVPYLHGLHIEAEDALAHWQPAQEPGRERLRVVVPVLPRMSNHTDFDSLRHHPDVDLQLIGLGDTKPPCDLMVLAGSKNTISDLGYLREWGWESYIQKHLRYGGKLIGICGGFQMLGRAIHDPQGVEGAPGSVAGLGMLPIDSTLLPRKQLKNVTGLLFGQYPVTGYEIHMGETSGQDVPRGVIQLEDGRQEGLLSEDGQTLGTYLHGLFDHDMATNALIGWAGHQEITGFDYTSFRETQIDRVADALEKHLDSEWLAQQIN